MKNKERANESIEHVTVNQHKIEEKAKLTLAITSKPKIYTVQKNKENNINDAKTPVHLMDG